MLMLRIKAGEHVKIGKDIKVCVSKGKYEQLYIGIEAPKEVLILRDKVVDRTESIATAAAATPPAGLQASAL